MALILKAGISKQLFTHRSALPYPTEKFLRNYGPRFHHIGLIVADWETGGKANINYIVETICLKGKGFLLDVISCKDEGLKQIFSIASEHSFLIVEYVHRFGDFDGFFTKSNVAELTAAAGVEENL